MTALCSLYLLLIHSSCGNYYYYTVIISPDDSKGVQSLQAHLVLSQQDLPPCSPPGPLNFPPGGEAHG